MNIGERIALSRKEKNISQAKLAELIGVTRGSCGHWEQGSSVPSVENLIRLSITLEVGFEWLTTGRGINKIADDNPVTTNELLEYKIKKNYLPTDQQELLARYKQLDSKGRSLIMQLISRI
jgi:transcriptional regulator with XRE-family HTH domain